MRKDTVLYAVRLKAFIVSILLILAGCGGGGGSDTGQPALSDNSAPVAVAGEDIELLESLSVQLDGTESRDIEGNSLTFQWRQLSGIPLRLTNENTATVTVTAPLVEFDQEAKIELLVMDELGLEGKDTITITVRENQSPHLTVDFPISGSQFFGETVTISGSVADDYLIDTAKVNVSTGSLQQWATVDSNGRWLMELEIGAEDQGEIQLQVFAEDIAGSTSAQESLSPRLMKSTVTTGTEC